MNRQKIDEDDDTQAFEPGWANGQFACQPNNRCLWYDQSLIPAETKFPDFQAAKYFYTVDGSRKWSAGDDWFYDIKEKK